MQLRMLAAILLLGSSSVHAVEEIAAPIIVTATRTAQTADETLAAVTVITREDIERQQATSIEDVLRGTPGLSLSNNGGLGKSTSIFLRGTESDHLLVLVDGVKVGSATLGTFSFQDMPVDQIERIEIVRGPRSSLYGSEAIGGVIQIFTRKGGGKFTPRFTIGAGSHDTYSGSAGVSGGGDQGWYNVNMSGIASDGFNACRGTLTAGCYTLEPDDDGYHNRSAALRGGHRFASGAELDAYALRTRSRVKFDGSFQNESASVQQQIGGKVAFSPLAPWRMSVAAGRSRDDSDNFHDGVFASTFNTRRDSASLQNDITFGKGLLVSLGADYQHDFVESDTLYVVTERRNTGVFGQYQGNYGAQDVQLALRSDDNQQFGHNGTGGLAWGYALTRTLRITASYGTAFKAPNFNDLYYPWYGNDALRPEKSRSAEFGLRGRGSRIGWGLNIYETTVRDLIGNDAGSALANIDKARIRGMEISGDISLDRLRLVANLSLLDPRNHSGGANDGNILVRRAKEIARLDADYTLGKLQFGATLRHEGKRYDDLDNKDELGAYATVDVRTSFAFARGWSMGARISNLFDKEYETAQYYNQDGRTFFATLGYHPAN